MKTAQPCMSPAFLRRALSVAIKVLGLVALPVVLLSISSDQRREPFTETERWVVKQVVAMMPKVAKDRHDALSGVYSWQLPVLPTCERHWGLPLSSLNPLVAIYFSRIYSIAPLSLRTKRLQRSVAPVDSIGSSLFCDPRTWRFWLDPFSYKLPPVDIVGDDMASQILKDDILRNRRNGYVSDALRGVLSDELTELRAGFRPDQRGRLDNVRLGTDVYSPLAANASRLENKITISEALIRFAFAREVVKRKSELRLTIDSLQKAEQIEEVEDNLTRLAAETIAGFRRSMRFVIAHELAHIAVPTVDEREADCYGLAAVAATEGGSDTGVFGEVLSALREGKDAYWNGLPAEFIEQRFKLIEIFAKVVNNGGTLPIICQRAWEGLD